MNVDLIFDPKHSTVMMVEQKQAQPVSAQHMRSDSRNTSAACKDAYGLLTHPYRFGWKS